MRAAADRGAEMVRKLLAFSRRGQLRVSAVDLGSIIRDTVGMLRRILPAHIEIATEVEPSAPIVNADRGAIEQILLNLATNARDAMPHGGALRIHAGDAALDEAFCEARGGGRAGAYAVLVISDTGTGMDAHTREHAFEPFFTTKAPGAGTGLGMAMIYGLVRQHEGFIDLESTPGVGTKVCIFIPASAESPIRADDRVAHARPLGNETILLVEDEPAILGTGKRILERHGYTVLTANNGEEALTLVRARGTAIDLVLSDVVMPRMGGGALHKAVVHEAGLPLRFLFTSGYTAREVGGMLDPDLPLVSKPWSVDELVRRVREVLDKPVAVAAPGD
jgi:two-component system NtrC family sensor kinase